MQLRIILSVSKLALSVHIEGPSMQISVVAGGELIFTSVTKKKHWKTTPVRNLSQFCCNFYSHIQYFSFQLFWLYVLLIFWRTRCSLVIMLYNIGEVAVSCYDYDSNPFCFDFLLHKIVEKIWRAVFMPITVLFWGKNMFWNTKYISILPWILIGHVMIRLKICKCVINSY